MTDRKPARGKLAEEYDVSHRLQKIHTPLSMNLTPMFEALEAARDAAEPKALKDVCTRFLVSLSNFIWHCFAEPKIARASAALGSRRPLSP